MPNACPQRAFSLAPWLRWLGWTLLLLLWSAALLTPHPVKMGRALLPAWALFLAAKGLHVSAYAFLAWLGERISSSRRLQLLMLGFLAVHAVATELLQKLVRYRTGQWQDVGLDLLGILLGVALSRWQSSALRSIAKLSGSASQPDAG